MHGETNTSENVFGNSAGERQLGRPRRRWMILLWILWKYGLDWIDEDQDRNKEGAVLNGIRNLRLPHGEGYFLRGTATAVLSRNLLHGISTRNNLSFVVQYKCAQIPVARSPGRLNFLR